LDLELEVGKLASLVCPSEKISPFFVHNMISGLVPSYFGKIFKFEPKLELVIARLDLNTSLNLRSNPK
jgi:hypothetical protein